MPRSGSMRVIDPLRCWRGSLDDTESHSGTTPVMVSGTAVLIELHGNHEHNHTAERNAEIAGLYGRILNEIAVRLGLRSVRHSVQRSAGRDTGARRHNEDVFTGSDAVCATLERGRQCSRVGVVVFGDDD